ncbi:hypothetical protein F4604DRAFT_1925835 [Suillus subluteus]|nr:hypothetical protein F4604DRAFT_1925835 [Suillus subluteus]
MKQLLENPQTLGHFFEPLYIGVVTINFNMVRYVDALQMMEKGIKPECEENLLAHYLPDHQILLDQPAVVCDKFRVVVLWYLPGAIDLAIQNDMAVATAKMSAPLARSVIHSAATSDSWRTHESNFYPSQHGVTPGCINLSPTWFLQGHPAPKFHPEVSATLKGNGCSFCQVLQRLAALIAATVESHAP